MKTIINIILSLLSIEVLADTQFDREYDKKNIAIQYAGDSTLTLSHDLDFLCKGRVVPTAIFKDNCGRRASDSILVTLNNADLKHPVVIDIYDENGASPKITSLIALDLDSDGSNELYIQVYNQHRHAYPGASADIIELFAYSNVIKRQFDTGTDVKRLYYLEEEFTKLFTSEKIAMEGPLYIKELKSALLLVKEINFKPKYLNKRGEFWYKKKNNHAKSTIHWYEKKYSFGYNIAISYFEAAIKKDPKYIPALSNLGIAYQKLGQYDKAIEAATQAIKLTDKPNQKASSHYNIAKAYEEKKNWTLALDHYKKAKSFRKHKAYEKGIKRMLDLASPDL